MPHSERRSQSLTPQMTACAAARKAGASAVGEGGGDLRHRTGAAPSAGGDSAMGDDETFWVRGLKLPREFSRALVESAMEYEPRDDDVFVVSYSKCGAAFVQHIVHLIFNKGHPSGDYVQWSKATPHLELVGAEAVRRMPRPNAVKSHLPVELMPWSERAKYIYVARNPKDCFVSIFLNRQLFLKQKSMDAAFQEFVSGDMIWGDYFDHVCGWYARRDEPNVMFLLYEDIKRSPHEVTERLAQFLGDEWLESVALDESALDMIVHHSSYDFMKEHATRTVHRFEKAKGEDDKKNEEEEEDDVDDVVVQAPALRTRTFARRGTVGDWRSTLNAAQERQLERLLRERSKDSGLWKLWLDLDEEDDSDF
ncbi:sulfotransferase 1C2-like [Dermacentor andersoni]|uniref:sulfotransferase 1C2-like n=1 Tax=Dermacentor andersoni TaxID=34620 RepID=UPI0021550C1B|nr:sulfotransferase 1C2-like [Dermacentor andersoni]XP_054922373.1 sulfotransferase 1C2-like [Dermacentor andersoni]